MIRAPPLEPALAIGRIGSYLGLQNYLGCEGSEMIISFLGGRASQAKLCLGPLKR